MRNIDRDFSVDGGFDTGTGPGAGGGSGAVSPELSPAIVIGLGLLRDNLTPPPPADDVQEVTAASHTQDRRTRQKYSEKKPAPRTSGINL